MTRGEPIGRWASLVYRPSLRRWRVHPVLAELRRLEAEQWLPPDGCAARHVSRLDDIVGHALARVPYYRRRLREAGLAECALRLPEDLQALPPLTRGELLAHRDELVAEGPTPRGAVWNHTGGSTGEPVSFLQDDAYRVANLAATARHDRWAGWRFGARTALLWGADRDRVGGLRQRLENRWFRRQVELNAFDLDATRLQAFAARVRSFRPSILRGYAGALDLLARFVRDGKLSLSPLRGVISCAETLEDDARRRIETVLGAPVFDRYGCRELGPVSSQCEEGRYHVNTRGVWVEILDGDRPAASGTTGRVVITGLATRSMPLLRYETGDVAEVPTERVCACGRGLPLMGRVHGRTSDFVMTPDGRLIHGEYFTHLFYGCAHVTGFRVHQDDAGRLFVHVSGDGDGLASEMQGVEEAMHQDLGGTMPIEVRHLASLPATASGKRCFVRSDLGPEAWRRGRVTGGVR